MYVDCFKVELLPSVKLSEKDADVLGAGKVVRYYLTLSSLPLIA